MNKNKYLITLWIDWYDYDDCVLQDFSIEYETTNLHEAIRKLDKIARQKVNEGLKEFQNFSIAQAPPERKSLLEDVDRDNKVIRKARRKIGDGSGHTYIYYDFDLIQVPAEAKVDENLFNLENCQQEVRSFFEYSYKQSQKNAQAKKRFIGLRQLAKSKLSLGGLNQKKTIDSYLEMNIPKKKLKTDRE